MAGQVVAVIIMLVAVPAFLVKAIMELLLEAAAAVLVAGEPALWAVLNLIVKPEEMGVLV
jgi:hypothetical protein